MKVISLLIVIFSLASQAQMADPLSSVPDLPPMNAGAEAMGLPATMAKSNTRLGYPAKSAQATSPGYPTLGGCLEMMKMHPEVLGPGKSISASNGKYALVEIKDTKSKDDATVNVYTAKGSATVSGTSCAGSKRDSNLSKEISKSLENAQTTAKNYRYGLAGKIHDTENSIIESRSDIKSGGEDADDINTMRDNLKGSENSLAALKAEDRNVQQGFIDTLQACSRDSDSSIAAAAQKALKDFGVTVYSAAPAAAPTAGSK